MGPTAMAHQSAPSPRSEGLGSHVVVIGVGSAGCRIVSSLEVKTSSPYRFVFVTDDRRDLPANAKGEEVVIEQRVLGRVSPFQIRGAASRVMPLIRGFLGGSKLAFIIAGLGGSVGTGVAPLIAQMARDAGVKAIGLFIMPFSFEKAKHFYAGTALRRLRKVLDGTILVDNDELIEQGESLQQGFEAINDKIALAISKIAGETGEWEMGVGLNRLLGSVGDGDYTIMSIFEVRALDRAEEALAGAIRSVYRMAEPDEARGALIHLVGDAQLSAGDVALSVKRVGSFLGRGSIEVHQGVSLNGAEGLTAILLASGFKGTRFDQLDPLADILKGREIDDEPDQSLDIDLPGIPLLE